MVIEQTRKWIADVVIACNFCPFAAREVKRGSVHYQVDSAAGVPKALKLLMQACGQLDNNRDIETSFLIFPAGFQSFSQYLQLTVQAEKLLQKEGYEGVYQVASFHPDYRFEDAETDDAANYTNRSPYPMLHLLREESIEGALKKYDHPEEIPRRNIDFARSKGSAYMKFLRDSCL